MKKWISLVLSLVLSSSLSLPAMAQQAPSQSTVQYAKKDWKAELAQFQATLGSRSSGRLWLSYVYNASKVVTACSASAAVTVSVFITDTLPITNVLAESIGNVVTPDYSTYETFWDTKTLIDLGRGTLGGGIVAVGETLEFIVLWLGGNEEQSWEALSKVYASTIKTAETLFAKQGQCLMSAAKLGLVAKELSKRRNAVQAIDELVTPIERHAPLMHPQQDPISLPSH